MTNKLNGKPAILTWPAHSSGKYRSLRHGKISETQLEFSFILFQALRRREKGGDEKSLLTADPSSLTLNLRNARCELSIYLTLNCLQLSAARQNNFKCFCVKKKKKKKKKLLEQDREVLCMVKFAVQMYWNTEIRRTLKHVSYTIWDSECDSWK